MSPTSKEKWGQVVRHCVTAVCTAAVTIAGMVLAGRKALGEETRDVAALSRRVDALDLDHDILLRIDERVKALTDERAAFQALLNRVEALLRSKGG